MPCINESNDGTSTTFSFADTPAIPSYIFAFAIGNFHDAESDTFVSTIATQSKLEVSKLEVICNFIPQFNHNSGI